MSLLLYSFVRSFQVVLSEREVLLWAGSQPFSVGFARSAETALARFGRRRYVEIRGFSAT